MMLASSTVRWALACVGAAALAFVATLAVGQERTVAGPQERIFAWLRLSDQQRAAIVREDPTFERDALRMARAFHEQREVLARMLVDPSASDRDIRRQLDHVIALENTLERRVSDFVLLMRRHLTPEQKKRLMGLIARGLRENAGPHVAAGDRP